MVLYVVNIEGQTIPSIEAAPDSNKYQTKTINNSTEKIGSKVHRSTRDNKRCVKCS